MSELLLTRQRARLGWTALMVFCLAGCQSIATSDNLGIHSDSLAGGKLFGAVPPPENDLTYAHGEMIDHPSAHRPPTELSPVSLPAYRVEPPDVLLIDVVRLAPKPPYYIQSLDVLQVFVLGTLPDQPIAGAMQVEPGGMINLGPAYGAVKVSGLSLREASDAIRQHLSRVLTSPEVSVSLLQAAGQQQVTGEHLVGPDGTVNLGTYGSVYVAGMTLAEARAAIERHLSATLEDPQISLDVFSYNSKVYYIIVEGAGFGDNVTRIPVTGKETVLDALAQIGGMQRISSKRIWIARPVPSGVGCDQILPVDWQAIVKGGATNTNFQILPGDRVFVAEDRLVALDTMVGKLTSPVERLMGVTLLSAQSIQAVQRFPKGLFIQ